jgi:methionyl-tRNA formyltransferase
MDPKGIHDMARTVGDVIDKVWDPPAILSVTSTRQCEDIYCALDPDFALSLYFAYPISKKMLDMKAKVVNLHPGKLPIERGPFPALWPTLYPEKYSMDDLCATFHYMNEKVDCGPIIREYPLKEHYPPDTTLATRKIGLLDVAIPVFFEHLDEVIELASNGYEGTPQQQPESLPQSNEGTTFGARRPTDEERTIQPGWSKERVLQHFRALGESDGLASPLFWWKGRRYWVERLEEWEWPGKELGKPGDVKRVGFDLIVMFEGGAVRMAARTR